MFNGEARNVGSCPETGVVSFNGVESGRWGSVYGKVIARSLWDLL